ncbi:2Fe-2S iron-sulfur cluster-binding protein [Zoogloea sp.]|uniref:2Fe-2S iron-sulfur cluster-binding protein n=1 Tax=Zoogloea sp. TaxID=49181 RepID=UPI0035AF8965
MAQKYLIHIGNSGEDYTCDAELNLLRGMEVLGRRGIPVGCRGGGCGVCKVAIHSGSYEARKMSRDCVSAEEEASGVVLACRVFPRGEMSLTVVGKMVKALERGMEKTAGAPEDAPVAQQPAWPSN